MNLQSILAAAEKIKLVANNTPVLTSRTLNEASSSQVYIKCENFQKGGAFKFRGAYNAISNLTNEAKSKGIITHSSGNHAQAVAIVSKILRVKSTIVMPKDAPIVKVNATRGYGANVVFSRPDIRSREKMCNELIDSNGYTLIHPYDNDFVITGAASASVELLEEVGDLDIIIAPVGGGGLISGTALYSKLSGKVTKVIAAEPQNADDAKRSFENNKLITDHTPTTIADGLRTLLSEKTFEVIKSNVDQIVSVSEKEIVNAMKFYWERMKLVVEASGAVSLAVFNKMVENKEIAKDSKVGIIISGGNVDLTDYFSKLSKNLTSD